MTESFAFRYYGTMLPCYCSFKSRKKNGLVCMLVNCISCCLQWVSLGVLTDSFSFPRYQLEIKKSKSDLISLSRRTCFLETSLHYSLAFKFLSWFLVDRRAEISSWFNQIENGLPILFTDSLQFSIWNTLGQFIVVCVLLLTFVIKALTVPHSKNSHSLSPFFYSDDNCKVRDHDFRNNMFAGSGGLTNSIKGHVENY
jgi:hypothetical protein